MVRLESCEVVEGSVIDNSSSDDDDICAEVYCATNLHLLKSLHIKF